MSSLKLVYGDTYETDIKKDYELQIIKLFANNIANKEFTLSYNSCKIWERNNLSGEIITKIIEEAQSINPDIRLTHVNKNSKYINMFPCLIEGAVEYFVLTDLKDGVMYSIYITPEKMNVF